jgi:tetratricopeptide (TPR) repeat protein
MILATPPQKQNVSREELYKALLRSLRRRKGFGLVFVQCSPGEAKRLLSQLMTDLPQKNIGVLELTEPIANLYEKISERADRESLNILFIQGLEKSLESDIKPGYGGDGDYYNLSSAPRILSHLNQQRERFKDNFGNICFVFILPVFAIKYFIRRAPDFFDWGTGVFLLPNESFKLSPSLQNTIIEGVETDKSLELEKILPVDELFSEDQKNRKYQIYFAQGIALGHLGQYEAEIASYDKALQINPDHSEVWYNRGIALDQLGQSEEAIASYDKALQINPVYPSAWCNRGVALDTLGQSKEAIASYDKALQINPNYLDAWYDRGIALGHLGQYEAEIASYDKALQINPNDHETLTNRGIALGHLGQYEAEIDSYDKALQINPDHSDAWYNRGIALNRLGQYEAEIASYDKALQIKPDCPNAWCNRGVALGQLGQAEAEIASYDKALQISLDCPKAWYNRGNALSRLGQSEEAIASYSKALQIKLDYHEAWYNQGITLGNLGQYEEAIASYNKALQIKPDYHEALTNLGTMLVKLGQSKEAIISYDKALAFKSNDPNTFYNKACCYALQVKLEPALKNLKQALELSPDRYREMVKTDSDFDSIRDNEQFQALIFG